MWPVSLTHSNKSFGLRLKLHLNLFSYEGDFMNIPLKNQIKQQQDLKHCINQSSTTRIVNICFSSSSLLGSFSFRPPDVSLSPSKVGIRRRKRRWKRSSLTARCSSDGRSDRGGGRSEGSSGDPLRRSAPFYIPHSDSIPHDSLCPWTQLEWFHQTPLRAGWVGYRLHI